LFQQLGRFQTQHRHRKKSTLLSISILRNSIREWKSLCASLGNVAEHAADVIGLDGVREFWCGGF